MRYIKEIANYIHNNLSQFTVDSNLFVDECPDIDNCILIRQNASPENITRSILELKFQVVSRNKNIALSEANCRSIYELFHQAQGIRFVTSELYINEDYNTVETGVASSVPFYLGKDEKKRYQYVTNVTCYIDTRIY